MTDFVRQVLWIFDDIDFHDAIIWRFDRPGAEPRFHVLCNDFFEWGTADAVEIEEVDLPLLNHCVRDVRAASYPPRDHDADVPALFCARKRGMRPQGAQYEHIPEDLRPLFDAAGPPRDVNIINPRPQPTEGGDRGHG